LGLGSRNGRLKWKKKKISCNLWPCKKTLVFTSTIATAITASSSSSSSSSFYLFVCAKSQARLDRD
jgi:hypothetical protein